MLRTAAKFAAGTIVGSLLWWFGTPLYDGLLALLGVPILHIDPRLRDLVGTVQGRWIFLQSASSAVGTALVPADQLTYNAILLISLVAAFERHLWRRRKLAVAAAALLALLVTHVLTFAICAESIYAATEAGGGLYGPVESKIWSYGITFLRLVGMLAIAFGFWIFVRTHGNDE
jgi:hypothetical protein